MDLYNEIRTRLINYIWGRDIHKLPRAEAYLLSALRVAYLTIRDLFFDSQLSLWAMSLVYTTLLSLVPLIAVSVSVLKGFGAHHQIEPLLMNFLEPLGERGHETGLMNAAVFLCGKQHAGIARMHWKGEHAATEGSDGWVMTGA